MLMRPNKAETAAHGRHCPGDMAVRMRKVLARSRVGVRVCHLLLLLLHIYPRSVFLWRHRGITSRKLQAVSVETLIIFFHHFDRSYVPLAR